MKPVHLLLLTALLLTPWFISINKLANCDFEPNYRCEVLHTVGLLPPIAFVTMWFDSDEKYN